MKTFSLTSIVMLNIVALSASVHAADVPSVKVRYADLDLGAAAGSAILYERVIGAAQTVCREWDPRAAVFSDLKPTIEQYKGCTYKVIVGAAAKINRPAFTIDVYEQMALPAASTNVRVASK
jgi:UrcA family protein